MSGPVPQAQRPLTARQAEAKDFILAHLRKHGFPPTIREVGKALGITSTNGVSDLLKALEKKGHVHRDVKGRARALLLVEKAPPETKVLADACRVALDLLKLNRPDAARQVLEKAVGGLPSTPHGGRT